MFKFESRKLSNWFQEIRLYNNFSIIRKDFFSLSYHKFFFRELVLSLVSDDVKLNSLPLTFAILIFFLVVALFAGVFKVFFAELMWYLLGYYLFCLVLFRFNIRFLKKLRSEE